VEGAVLAMTPDASRVVREAGETGRWKEVD